MDCRETRERLQEEREGLAPPPAAKEHLARCGECRSFAARLAEVDGALASEPELAFPPGLAASILGRAARDRRRSRLLAAAAAAMVLAAAGFGYRFLSELAADAVPGSTGVPGLPASLGEGLRDLGAAAAGLVEAVLGAFASVPGGAGLPVAIGALAALLTLNGLVVARLAAAEGRRS